METLRFALIVALFCAFVCPVAAHGRTIIVPDDFLKIQDALYDSNTGDTIFIREGIYYETSISVVEVDASTAKPPVRRSITIMGEGMGRTIIDGSKGGYDIFIVNAPYTIIRDLTVRNGKDSGISFQGKGEISVVVNCECTGNRSGIKCQIMRADQILKTDITKPLIIANRLVNNNYYGLYFENGCQAVAMQNWIEGNGYAGVYCRVDLLTPCEPVIRNNHIINNAPGGDVFGGVVVARAAQPTVRNNVIVGFPIGAYWYDGTHVDWFRNNIIMECGIGAQSQKSQYIDYCLFYDNGEDFQGLVKRENCITGQDPLFVDPENGDYHLRAGSPCRGSGDPEMPDGTTETNYDGSDIDMGVYGGKEVGAACRILLSKPSSDRGGLKTYYVAEQYEDLNGNGSWDHGEPFDDVNDSGIYDADERFTDENHNGYWDEGELYIDLNYSGRYDSGEPFTDLNGNNQWDEQREPFADDNRNGKYDRGALLTFISIYTCFGYEAEETDLFLALLLENGDLFTCNTSGAWASGGPWPMYSTFVGDNFAYAIHSMTLRFFHGFPLVDQNIGLYSVMAPANHVLDQPWDAIAGQTIRLTDSQ